MTTHPFHVSAAGRGPLLRPGSLIVATVLAVVAPWAVAMVVVEHVPRGVVDVAVGFLPAVRVVAWTVVAALGCGGATAIALRWRTCRRRVLLVAGWLGVVGYAAGCAWLTVFTLAGQVNHR